MKRRYVLATGVATVLAHVGGVAAKPKRPRNDAPPRLTLRTGSGDSQRASRGTYCWRTRCVDYMGMPHPVSALLASSGEALSLRFRRLGKPSGLAYEIWQFDDSIQGEISRQGYVGEEPVASDSFRSPVSPIALPDDLPTGLYVIDVYAAMPWGGDTAQGFKVRIQSDAPVPST